jgi:hypothetical protein
VFVIRERLNAHQVDQRFARSACDVVAGFLQQRPARDLPQVRVGFLVDDVALRQVFPPHFRPRWPWKSLRNHTSTVVLKYSCNLFVEKQGTPQKDKTSREIPVKTLKLMEGTERALGRPRDWPRLRVSRTLLYKVIGFPFCYVIIMTLCNGSLPRVRSRVCVCMCVAPQTRARICKLSVTMGVFPLRSASENWSALHTLLPTPCYQ